MGGGQFALTAFLTGGSVAWPDWAASFGSNAAPATVIKSTLACTVEHKNYFGRTSIQLRDPSHSLTCSYGFRQEPPDEKQLPEAQRTQSERTIHWEVLDCQNDHNCKREIQKDRDRESTRGRGRDARRIRDPAPLGT